MIPANSGSDLVITVRVRSHVHWLPSLSQLPVKPKVSTVFCTAAQPNVVPQLEPLMNATNESVMLA